MKRIFFITLIFIISISNLIAQKCKPKFTNTDEFTEVTTEYWGSLLTSMSVYSLNVKYLPYLTVFEYDNKNYIQINIEVDGKLDNSMVLNNHNWFEKGSSFMFKLEEDLLTFTVEESRVRQSGGTSATIISSITEEQIEMLKNQQILKGRVYPFIDNQDMIFQFSVAKGKDKKIKQQLECFLKG